MSVRGDSTVCTVNSMIIVPKILFIGKRFLFLSKCLSIVWEQQRIRHEKKSRRNWKSKLPFLDCLVSRDNNELRTKVYRKPMHTDRLVAESS